jgi:hypothetical protein
MALSSISPWESQRILQERQYEYQKKARQLMSYYGIDPANMFQDEQYVRGYRTETRSMSDVREIAKLKEQLKEKVDKRQNDLRSLIAYYYQR